MKPPVRVFAGLALLLAFVTGYAAGRFGGTAARDDREAPELEKSRDEYEIRGGGQRYTNPLLECELASERLFSALRPFDTLLDALVDSLEKGGSVGSVAVYFRDLNNGPWVGHHEQSQYIPASLAKLPVMIACFRHAESDPGFLARQLVFEGLAMEREPGFMNPESNLVRGRSYSVEELVQRVATFSDNAATRLLRQALPPGLVERVYADLGVDPARMESPDFALSPKEYGAFFRVLYNSSYLSRRFSELALQYLDRATFELGLVAGVPEGVAVAHKFGVWEDSSSRRLPLQLHDCGIVYHPQRPYLLCVMTSGSNYVEMAKAIAAVSRLAYVEVDRGLSQPGEALKAMTK